MLVQAQGFEAQVAMGFWGSLGKKKSNFAGVGRLEGSRGKYRQVVSRM
jgi:hypothetical protein